MIYKKDIRIYIYILYNIVIGTIQFKRIVTIIVDRNGAQKYIKLCVACVADLHYTYSIGRIDHSYTQVILFFILFII